MRILPVGARALLVEVDTAEEVAAVHAELRRRRVACEELVPGARTVLVDGLADSVSLARELPTWHIPPVSLTQGPVVEIPVSYDGPDLERVASLWEADVAEVHSGCEYRVGFCGFMPGFGYLTGLPAQYHVPRRETPRTSVPAGSVGIAGEYTGVYPRASPGGWHLIGHTTLTLWDPDRDPAALLAPGTRVRFRQIR